MQKKHRPFLMSSVIILVIVIAFLSLRGFTGPENLRVADKLKTTVVFDTLDMDFGLLKYNQPEKATYTFTNTGTHPLIIYRVTASCGCTEVEWPEKIIRPGKSDNIMITYDAAHQGQFRKTVYIYANTKNSPTELTLKGTVEGL